MKALQRFVTDRAATAAPAAPAGAERAEPAVPEVLRRMVGPRRRPAPGEVCELCARPIDGDHRHVVDLRRQRLTCACRGCALLFEDVGAGGSRYRAVPERHLRVDGFALERTQWTALQIPVAMAFFMVSTPAGRTVAFYPSPGGATESELALDAWDDIVAANPPLAGLTPDVEAALIRVDERGAQCFVVPIDRCYALVGALRLHWHGFDGGSEVRERIRTFFADLEARSAGHGRTP